MKIAVFCPNWVGDLVMATPALRAIRWQFPEAEVIGVVRPYLSSLLEGTGLLDRIIPLPHGKKKTITQSLFAASGLFSVRNSTFRCYCQFPAFRTLELLTGRASKWVFQKWPLVSADSIPPSSFPFDSSSCPAGISATRGSDWLHATSHSDGTRRFRS